MKELPQGATKLFEGMIFDVYQWEQEQFDGTYKTFECVKRLNNTVVIPVFGDKILIIKEEQPGTGGAYWCLPAGRFDRHEIDSLEVSKRELLEEVGAVSDTWELFDIYDKGGTTAVGVTYVYIARNCNIIQDPNPDVGGEILHDMRYVTYDEFLDLYKKDAIRGGSIETAMLRALCDVNIYNTIKNKIFQ